MYLSQKYATAFYRITLPADTQTCTREEQKVEEVMETSKESEYSDSSMSSADEEESEDETPNVAPYVHPKH